MQVTYSPVIQSPGGRTYGAAPPEPYRDDAPTLDALAFVLRRLAADGVARARLRGAVVFDGANVPTGPIVEALQREGLTFARLGVFVVVPVDGYTPDELCASLGVLPLYSSSAEIPTGAAGEIVPGRVFAPPSPPPEPPPPEPPNDEERAARVEAARVFAAAKREREAWEAERIRRGRLRVDAAEFARLKAAAEELKILPELGPPPEVPPPPPGQIIGDKFYDGERWVDL